MDKPPVPPAGWLDSVLQIPEPVVPSWKVARAAFHDGTFTVHPEAYWNSVTRELIAYNLDFAELLQLPDEILRGGFLWSDIDLQVAHAHHRDRKAASIIEREHSALVNGFESNARFVVVLGRLHPQRILVFATAIGCELHWLCVPQSEADTLIARLRDAPLAALASARIANRNSTPFDANLTRFPWKKTTQTRATRGKQRKIGKGNITCN